MSQGNGGGGGEDATGIIIVVIIAGLLLYFYKYAIFFVWIPTKIAELWIWSQFHPNYTVHLRHFVDTVTIMKLHWRDAMYVNGQILSIAGHGWFKPIALLQTFLAVLMAGLVWFKVRQGGMKPIASVKQLVSVQKAQFPWGQFWLEKPRSRKTIMRPHEIFGKKPDIKKNFDILYKQLGKQDRSFYDLPEKLQGLYAAFALQNNGDIEAAQDQLKALALGKGLTNASKEKIAIAEKDWKTRNGLFRFERCVFADALFHARSQNLLPSSWFNWLKIEQRALWMTLNSTPPYRQVIKPVRVAAEAVGPLSWWIYVQYRSPLENDLQEELKLAFGGITTLDEALKEVDYVG